MSYMADNQDEPLLLSDVQEFLKNEQKELNMKRRTITIEISFLEPDDENGVVEEMTVKVDGQTIERDNSGTLRGVDDHYDIWQNYACGISLQYGEY
jgi:hypothetical protein